MPRIGVPLVKSNPKTPTSSIQLNFPQSAKLYIGIPLQDPFSSHLGVIGTGYAILDTSWHVSDTI
jgi:hypothetical protein